MPEFYLKCSSSSYHKAVQERVAHCSEAIPDGILYLQQIHTTISGFSLLSSAGDVVSSTGRRTTDTSLRRERASRLLLQCLEAWMNMAGPELGVHCQNLKDVLCS